MTLTIPTSWYSWSCVVSSPWIWWLASNKANTVIRRHLWDMTLQTDNGLCWACSHSSICFIWAKPAALLWADIWRRSPGIKRGLQSTASKAQRPSSPTTLEELNSTKSQVRNLGSRSFLVEASDETTAPAVNSTTTSWDTRVWGTQLCCTLIPDPKNCETMLF